jgi:zinc transport system substrate-binding protein
VVFKSGGDLDKWLDSAVRTANSDRTPVDLSQAAVLDPESGKQFNAHWFLDPTNLAAAAQRVRDELIKANPNARETYRANATAYVARTRAVDAALKRCVENAGPIAIVTGHDDFDYLARRYNIEIAARLTSGGQSAPSLADVRDANSHARAAHAEAFVISHGESNRLAEGFADKAGLPVLELYSDSLAAPGEPAGTALGAVAFDVGKLVGSATGGEVKCPIPNAS